MIVRGIGVQSVRDNIMCGVCSGTDYSIGVQFLRSLVPFNNPYELLRVVTMSIRI